MGDDLDESELSENTKWDWISFNFKGWELFQPKHILLQGTGQYYLICYGTYHRFNVRQTNPTSVVDHRNVSGNCVLIVTGVGALKVSPTKSSESVESMESADRL